jgi:hypothetical protein
MAISSWICGSIPVPQSPNGVSRSSKTFSNITLHSAELQHSNCPLFASIVSTGHYVLKFWRADWEKKIVFLTSRLLMRFISQMYT